MNGIAHLPKPMVYDEERHKTSEGPRAMLGEVPAVPYPGRDLNAVAWHRRLTPGKPAADCGPICRVRRPEHSLKVRLFVEHDEGVKADADGSGVPHERQRPVAHQPAEDGYEHADIHWIACVPVQASHDQLCGRIDRCRRAAPKRREVPHAPCIDGRANEK